jgi:c(7)-type cytochrome triheme protein
MSPARQKQIRSQRLKLIVLLGLLVFTFYGYTRSSNSVDGSLLPATAEPEQTPELPAPQNKDYSHFTHTNAYHSRMPCLLCHRRDTNATRISFPGRNGHTPCIGCHQLQFGDSGSPICTICHTNAEAGQLKGFPHLKTFGRKFVHSSHTRVACATCHKTNQRGAGFSIPSGPTAHNTCFSCHSSNASYAMSSCNVCHQQGRLSRAPETSRAYRINFSHALHVNKGMSCTSCHSVRRGAGARQVSAPAVAMHFVRAGEASCGACHNSVKAFGTSDFANCKRCHNGNSFKF